MAGYGYGAPGSQPPYGSNPYAPPGQPYAAGPPPYGAPSAPYGAPSAPHAPPYAPGEKPPKEGKPHKYDQGGMAPPSAYPAPSAPYGAPSAPHAPPYAPGEKPPKEGKPHKYDQGGMAPPSAYPAPSSYSSPFAALLPSTFPPGTDPSLIACFQMADQDGSGFIDDKELQRALSSYNQSFSIRTVHLLMYLFTNSNVRRIGPKEFSCVFDSLQNWRGIFERFDRDRSGKIDVSELREALLSLGFSVSPVILDLLVTKFDKSGGKNKAIEYDNFIECCLTVKGLTEKFKERDTAYSGSAMFSYEAFMLTVLPFLIA